MDNNNQVVIEEQKSALTKVLAIVGFFALIILMVWLAVKIVGVVPNAFSSLASIADSVYNYNRDEELSVATEKSVVNANESFVISWDTLRAQGTYEFSYACTEGVSVEVRDAAGGIRALTCDTKLDVSELTSLDVRVASEKNRFTDVSYTLTFTPQDDGKAIITKDGLATIVNATIPTGGEEVAVEGGETEAEPVEEAESEVVPPSTDEAPTTPAPTPAPQPTTPSYTYVENVTYAAPVSNPNGNTDLVVTFKAVGIMEGSRFVPKARIETDEKGAIQFEIKNIGTKTSAGWSYVAELPSGIEYESGTQKVLKPQERALITLGFEGISETGTEKFGVEVTTNGDTNSKNNSFTWAVTIVD